MTKEESTSPQMLRHKVEVRVSLESEKLLAFIDASCCVLSAFEVRS
jgi:hypothetical protein